MLNRRSIYDLAMAACAVSGLLCVLLGWANANVVRLGTILITTGPATFYVSMLAERFFDPLRSRILQWLVHGGFAMLVATCVLEVIDAALFTPLVVLQVMLLVSMQIGLTMGALGLAAASAMNGFRVASARTRSNVSVLLAACIAVTPWLGWQSAAVLAGLVLVVRTTPYADR